MAVSAVSISISTVILAAGVAYLRTLPGKLGYLLPCELAEDGHELGTRLISHPGLLEDLGRDQAPLDSRPFGIQWNILTSAIRG